MRSARTTLLGPRGCFHIPSPRVPKARRVAVLHACRYFSSPPRRSARRLALHMRPPRARHGDALCTILLLRIGTKRARADTLLSLRIETRAQVGKLLNCKRDTSATPDGKRRLRITWRVDLLRSIVNLHTTKFTPLPLISCTAASNGAPLPSHAPSGELHAAGVRETTIFADGSAVRGCGCADACPSCALPRSGDRRPDRTTLVDLRECGTSSSTATATRTASTLRIVSRAGPSQPTDCAPSGGSERRERGGRFIRSGNRRLVGPLVALVIGPGDLHLVAFRGTLELERQERILGNGGTPLPASTVLPLGPRSRSG